MNPAIIIGISVLLGALFAVKSKKSSTESTSTGQIPMKAKDISNVLAELENHLGLKGLHDVFMGFAKVESNFVPTATRKEPNGYVGVENNIGKFYANPWKNDKDLWRATKGLFQQFPYSALLTADGTAVNNNPDTLYDWKYAIAYALDFAYRLHSKYGAQSYWDIRRGWASIKTLNSPNSSYAMEVLGRLLKGIKESGGDTTLIYQVPDWTMYKQMGFKKTLEFIQQLKI